MTVEKLGFELSFSFMLVSNLCWSFFMMHSVWCRFRLECKLVLNPDHNRQLWLQLRIGVLVAFVAGLFLDLWFSCRVQN